MYKKMLSNFSSGVNLACAPLQLGLDSNKTAWAEGLNVEIFGTKGVCRQNGNELLTQVPDAEGITSIFTYTPAERTSRRRVLYTTSSGKFCEYNTETNTHSVLKTGLNTDNQCIYTEYLTGVALSNGYDEPFYYKCDSEGISSQICEMNTVSKDGETPIKAQAMCTYKSRLWLADGDTLYYSALGMYDDWETVNDAGFISNFHCDASPIKALKTYKDYIAIYKPNSVYLLTGSSPEDFAIVPFADKGAASQNAVVSANNKQYFFSDALFTLEQTGLLAQITLGSEASLAIKPALNGNSDLLKTLTDQDGNKYGSGGALDKNKLKQVYALSYEIKNQLWFFVPTINNPYINNVWIYDYINESWTLRTMPQPTQCAANYGENIITGTADGRILIEDKSKTFDGTPIVFQWKSPFLTLGNPNSRKLIDDFYFLISDGVDNNFKFCAYKDYDTLDAQDHEEISVNNLQNLLWASDLHEGEQYLWANEFPDQTQQDTSAGSLWAVTLDTAQKAEISGSCLAVQFCIYGDEPAHNFALLALEYKEITQDP